ncbi:hypothetical protein DdX_20258 [Ditylenchus destructor]|uniref:Uncharacterized protein n=1 Tax=Ditylenchus destructor TaxID=166010 RepID=A0AAD4MJ08_9BILA|nr:hypothetical protein DdX_20258 [Ditylenchus destructor]
MAPVQLPPDNSHRDSCHLQTLILGIEISYQLRMISKLVRCVLLFSCLCAAEKVCGRLKILVHMTSIGYSHVQFQGKIADELANAGHEVQSILYTLIREIV